MSTSATGIVAATEDGTALAGLNIRLEDVTQVQELVLDTAVTGGDGKFTLKYSAYPAINNNAPGNQPRGFRLSVLLGQLVIARVDKTDLPDQTSLDFGKITVKKGESTSRLTTLGAGTASRVSTGNALRWLVDNEAGWKQTADVITHAGKMLNPDGTPVTLDIMQLDIDVNPFNKDLSLETPKIVLDFKESDPAQGLNLQENRIERMLLTSASTNKLDVRLQLPIMSIEARVGVGIVAAVLVGFGSLLLLSVGIYGVLGAIIGGLTAVIAGVAVIILAVVAVISFFAVMTALNNFRTTYRKSIGGEIATEKWFVDADAADTTAKQVRIRELAHRSLTITHAKTVIAGGQEAVLLGSPFNQVYYDSQSHLVDEARRGGEQSKGPIHDVSVGLRGPAVGDLQELFNSHWNIADPSDLQDMPPKLKVPATVVASTDPADVEFATTVQLVFTKDRKFTQAPQDGEKGVQEAYLRAIHFAQQFIYIENQYFYNRRVVQGLMDALKANKNLVLILLLNPSPDMPYYLRWQNTAVQSIIDALTDKKDPDAVGKQLGVFSSWSYADAATGKKLPRLCENYLHTKSAIIDNNWATVGSANLDGASMDAEDYFKSVMDGEARHTEANVVISENETAQPSAVDALRRCLWGEHLGFFMADPAHPGKMVVETANSQLDGSSTTPGSTWLNLWNTRAKARLAALAGNPADAKAIHILPWPVAKVKLSAWQDLTRSMRGAKDHYAREIYLDHLFRENAGSLPLTRSQFDLSVPQGAPFKYAKT